MKAQSIPSNSGIYFTGSKCYHDERHPMYVESETGWCIGCLFDLEKQNEIQFLSHHVENRSNYPTPLTAMNNLRKSVEDGLGRKLESMEELIGEVNLRCKATAKSLLSRRRKSAAILAS